MEPSHFVSPPGPLLLGAGDLEVLRVPQIMTHTACFSKVEAKIQNTQADPGISPEEAPALFQMGIQCKPCSTSSWSHLSSSAREGSTERRV